MKMRRRVKMKSLLKKLQQRVQQRQLIPRKLPTIRSTRVLKSRTTIWALSQNKIQSKKCRLRQRKLKRSQL